MNRLRAFYNQTMKLIKYIENYVVTGYIISKHLDWITRWRHWILYLTLRKRNGDVVTYSDGSSLFAIQLCYLLQNVKDWQILSMAMQCLTVLYILWEMLHIAVRMVSSWSGTKHEFVRVMAHGVAGNRIVLKKVIKKSFGKTTTSILEINK